MHSTRALGELLGVPEWRVRRIFEDGTLPEPKRFGGKRVITSQMIPAVVRALEDRGWIGVITTGNIDPPTGQNETSRDTTETVGLIVGGIDAGRASE